MYLSMVDCGPERFTIWNRIRGETAEVISTVLEEVFLERGPVTEVLMDNGKTFQSTTLKEMLDKWDVRCFLGDHTDRAAMELSSGITGL